MIIIAHDDDCAISVEGNTIYDPCPKLGHAHHFNRDCTCGGHKYRLNLGDRYDDRRWTALVEEVTE